MPVRHLDPRRYSPVLAVGDANADWFGNNAAFACPVCSKVFVVSKFISDGVRQCPGCGKSRGVVTASPKDTGAKAYIEWDFD
jgi:ribosomal protein L37AE/L43A